MTGQFPKKRESDFAQRMREDEAGERKKWWQRKKSRPDTTITRSDLRTARRFMRRDSDKLWFVPGSDEKFLTPYAKKELKRRRRAGAIAKASRAAQRRASAAARRKRQKRRTYSR